MSEYSVPGLPEIQLTEDTLPILFWLGDRIPGGFFIYRADEAQEMLYANHATLRIFGCETLDEFKALTGYTFRGLVHPEDFDEIQSSIDRQIADAKNENLDYVEYRIVRKDGSVRWIDDYGHFAHMPGYGDVYYVFIIDVTEKRQAQEARFRMELELQRQKHASEVKSAFLFSLSHDIRTPMNAVIGFSELAQRHIGEPERVADYLRKLDDSSRKLLGLIDDLLDMNQLDGGGLKLRPEPADLGEQLELVTDRYREAAKKKQLTFTVDAELPGGDVLLDTGAFSRIMGSLLGNAVKFTPENGSVAVSAQRRQASDSGYARYEFTVSDTGVGMSEDFMPRMFDAFEREESSTKTGVTGTGTGLGLTIAKSLVDIMGGTISAVSAKGEGTTFTVALPLRSAESGASPDASAAADNRAAGEYRVLIVEDIELNRMLVEEFLEEAGFLAESVPDGCDAVETVRNHPPGYFDLILMDIQMPVMNGYEATRAIRSLGREDTERMPIIALSANAREEDKRMSLDSGMNYHIAKPFEPDNLIATVNEYIAAARQSS